MAFQTESNVSPINAAKNDGWKADAFVNIFIMSRKGKKAKMGVMKFKLSNALEKQVMEHLSESGEEGLSKLKDMLILDFQLAGVVDEDDGLDFG